MAHKLIKEDCSKYKEQILEVINEQYCGIRYCEYENNILFGKSVEDKIEDIKSMIELKDKLGFLDKIVSLTVKEKEHNIDSLEEKNIALYIGKRDKNSFNNIKSLANSEGIKVVDFDLAFKKAGQTLLNYNREMASIKAGKTMLEAFDNGADILVCINNSDVDYFRKIQGYSEKELGRDIGIKIISTETFKNLLLKVSA